MTKRFILFYFMRFGTVAFADVRNAHDRRVDLSQTRRHSHAKNTKQKIKLFINIIFIYLHCIIIEKYLIINLF